MGLKQQIQLKVAHTDYLNYLAQTYHYMKKPIHDKACPFGFEVYFNGINRMGDGKPAGFIMFATPHFTKLVGEFGYKGLPTKWQVLLLSRLWLHDNLPKNSETCTIAKALKLVQRRWIEVHPPVFPNQPYHILKVLSYCDTATHTGTIYKAANFRVVNKTTTTARPNGSRGNGTNSELITFAYDLPYPRWSFFDIQPKLL